jgi:signal transduction histidine kinase
MLRREVIATTRETWTEARWASIIEPPAPAPRAAKARAGTGEASMAVVRRVALIGGTIVAVSLAHYLTPVAGHGGHGLAGAHALYRWFYHLPIILAGFWFGLRGGLATSGAVILLYAPHVLVQWSGGTPDQWLEMALYLVVGAVTGLLSEGQKRDRDRYRRTAEDLDHAYRELREKTVQLLRTEESLRQAERLSALGQLTAGLAHEIKTPLASIRGASEILGGDRTSDEERGEFSGILVKEVDRLTDVVNRFLEFARPREADVAAADVGETIEEVARLVRAEARRQGVEIVADRAPDPPRAAIDATQLGQVVLNLVVNALQAMPEGGRLEVAAAAGDGGIRLVVRDTGGGIPDAIRARIFDPFVTGREHGTGLGLSIVRRILDHHGATIEIRTRSGGGTEVEVRLPVAEERHEGREDDPPGRR